MESPPRAELELHVCGSAGARVTPPVNDLKLSFWELGGGRCARRMIGSQQLKFRRANFAQHAMSHQNQNRSFDNSRRLDRRMMRDMANRARCVGAALMMVLERRLRRQKQQREDRQTSQQRLDSAPRFAVTRVGLVIHLLLITLAPATH